MTALVANALDAYQRLDVETGVAAASPQRLIVMLYEGALKAVHTARGALARGDVAGRGTAISKAIAIVDEGLRPALDLKAGGEIAANLSSLYDYIVNRLLYANLKQDEASLDEAAHLLSELKSAWEALDRKTRADAASEPSAAEERRAALSYGRV
jgi:flagellar protein FliS